MSLCMGMILTKFSFCCANPFWAGKADPKLIVLTTPNLFPSLYYAMEVGGGGGVI